jgi:hypothetical protein
MKYLGGSFSVALGSQAYRDNFDRIFRQPKTRTCNLHEDCDAADQKAREAKTTAFVHGTEGVVTVHTVPASGAQHCHSDDCEECFPK